jgi:hypothetical protein
MLQLFKENQVNNIKNNIKKIIKNANKKEMEIIKPTLIDSKKIIKIILDFIIKKKRILYGDFAIYNLMLMKNSKTNIEIDLNIPFIEFYSCYPIQDIMELCDLFHSHGYKYIMGKNTMDKNIFMVEIDFNHFCNCSYMPLNIYNNISYIKYNNYFLIAPEIIYIEAYKIFTDPLDSYKLLENTFTNTYLLQTKYPLHNNKGTIIFNNNETEIFEHKILCQLVLQKYIKNKNIILINIYAYNYYVYNKIDITELDIISFNYNEDCNNIYNLLKETYKNSIKKTEYLPFFSFIMSIQNK